LIFECTNFACDEEILPHGPICTCPACGEVYLVPEEWRD